MRFFALLNLQHVVLYFFPTMVFIILFGLALRYSHFRGNGKPEVLHHFPDDLKEQKAPIPLALWLIIVGTVIWAFLYIFFTGMWEVKI
jgi:hypothetical protein